MPPTLRGAPKEGTRFSKTTTCGDAGGRRDALPPTTGRSPDGGRLLHQPGSEVPAPAYDLCFPSWTGRAGTRPPAGGVGTVPRSSHHRVPVSVRRMDRSRGDVVKDSHEQATVQQQARQARDELADLVALVMERLVADEPRASSARATSKTCARRVPPAAPQLRCAGCRCRSSTRSHQAKPGQPYSARLRWDRGGTGADSIMRPRPHQPDQDPRISRSS